MRTSSINFLPKKDSSQLVKATIGACLGTSAVMVWAFVWGPGGPKSATIGTEMNETPISTTSPVIEAVARKPQALSDNTATSPSLGQQGDTVSYYETPTGRSFRVDLKTSRNESLSDTLLPGFLSTVWSPSGHEVVSVFDVSGARTLKYFNYTTRQSAAVGTAATAVAFAPDGQRLAYIDTVNGQSAIYIGSADGSDARKVLAVRATDVLLSWPGKDLLFFSSRRPDGNSSDLSSLTPDGKLSAVLSNKVNLEYTWSRDGGKLLFSYFTEQGLELWYADMRTGTVLPLSASTAARKCAWTPDSSAVVCGIPPEGTLTSDIPSERISTRDDITVIDVLSGNQTKVYATQKGAFVGVTEPLVSSSGAFFVFVNAFDHRLYRLPLP